MEWTVHMLDTCLTLVWICQTCVNMWGDIFLAKVCCGYVFVCNQMTARVSSRNSSTISIHSDHRVNCRYVLDLGYGQKKLLNQVVHMNLQMPHQVHPVSCLKVTLFTFQQKLFFESIQLPCWKRLMIEPEIVIIDHCFMHCLKNKFVGWNITVLTGKNWSKSYISPFQFIARCGSCCENSTCRTLTRQAIPTGAPAWAPSVLELVGKPPRCIVAGIFFD